MPEPKKSPLPQAEMKPTPQNETVGAIASALKRAQQATSQYKVPEFIPLLGGTGMDEMLGLPGAAAEVERWSYGDYPLTTENTGTAGNIPRIKTKKGEDGRRESRMMDLVDTAGVVAPLSAYAKKVGTNIIQTAPAVARDMLESAASPMRSYVIKPKGGNWLTPTETRTEIPDIYAPNERRPQAKAALESMYEAYGPNLEAVQGNQFQNVFETNVKKLKADTAIDDWINSNLTNYVKKEMATPEDPVRKLAEEGIHFMTPTQVDRIDPLAAYSDVTNKRIGAGFPEEGMGKSQEARAWEALSDAAIDVEYADQYDLRSPAVDRQLKADPWISKLNPDDPLYSISGNYRGFDRNIDFEKVIKSLREDVDEGAIRPEQLNKVSVADAVRRFYEKNIARQNVAFASRLERPAVKEYPEQGFRWVKLDQPGDFAAESEAMQHSVRGYEPYEGSEYFVRDLGGDSGYGLGGWDAIEYGDAEVYSLVDSKGRPHATIEVETDPGPESLGFESIDDWFRSLNAEDRIKAQNAVREWRRQNPYVDELEDFHVKDALRDSGIEFGGPKITQIKGKQNRPPNPEYQPFVEDFIRSKQWSDVEDLDNTNLIRLDPDSDVAEILRSEGLDVPKYISDEELTDIRRKWSSKKTDEWNAAENTKNLGMAKGGKVKFSDNPVTMQLELAGGGLVKRMAKAIGKAAEEAGQKPPVLAEKELTTLQDVHTNLGDRVRAGVIDSQKMMEGFDYKYDKGQRVFTKDSAGKNKPPYTILNRTRVGNQVMREDHPEFGPGMGKPIIDSKTGKAMRTPYEPGYRVRMERGPDDWSEFEIPEKAIVGDVEMAGGGAIKNAIKRVAKSMGEYGAKRLERSADEVPNLEKQFTEDALVEAFTGDNAKAIVTVSPEDFEKYAKRLRGRDSITFADKQALDRGVIDKYTLPTDEYVQYLSRIKGFDDVPMLNLFKDETGLPMKPQITGHEGRHRSRALAKSGEPTSIVRVMPRGDLREGMPRRDQEEFIQALREELGLSDRLVLPEKEDYFDQRPAISLPEVYAGGGAIKKMAKSAAKILPSSKADENLERFLAESKIKDRLYHGTGADITEFRPSKIGAMGPGTYLSTSPKEASGYAGILNRDYEARPNVLPVFAQAKNPFVISNVNKSHEELFKRFDPEGKLSDEKVIQRVKDAGYDSIYAKDSGELNMLNINSIKSAIGNRGTYDTKKKDITKAKGGAIRMGAGGTVAQKIIEALAKGAAKDAAKEAPTVAKKPVQEAIKASEALGKYEGRPLVITQTDRTKTGGKWLGGPGFSSLQLSRPEYAAAEAAWGVAKPGAAKMILGGGKKAGDNPLYTTMIGTPTQHQSNNMVFGELHRLFSKSAKEGNLDPDLYLKINDRLRSAVDKNGNPVFPSDIDILDPKFRNLADTFDRRLVASNLMGGVGVGGKKGQIIDYDKIIRHTTDPDLLDAPSGALGNRLFTLTGNVIERPDLHPAFPSILQGEDLGVKFKPVPRELVMKDFADRIMREKGRKPGYMDYTRGHPPSQMLTEELLTELQKQGYKKGGSVNKTSTSNKPRKKVAFTDNLDTMRLAVGLK